MENSLKFHCGLVVNFNLIDLCVIIINKKKKTNDERGRQFNFNFTGL